MNNDLKNHALVIATAAMMNAEIAGMQAENQHRISCGHSIAYDEAAFVVVMVRYSSVLGHNSVIQAFNS